MGFQKNKQDRHQRHQIALMDIQQQNQMELNEDGKRHQLDIWDKTGYEAQQKQIKKAGLNQGLLYGMGGTGGATTGSQGGGSAQGGQAAMTPPMDIAQVANAAQVAAGIALTKAQKDKTVAETDSIRGVEGTTGGVEQKKTGAETESEEMKKFLIVAQKELAEGNMAKVQEEMRLIATQNDVLSGQETALVKKTINEATLLAVKAEAEKAKITLTEEQERKIGHEIYVMWVNAGLKGLDTIVKGKLGDIGKKK